jgi:orotate phosphoribosyltransferase-like protein
VKPKKAQQEQLEAQKLSERGLKVTGIAQKLWISLERVKKLLTG